MYYKFKRLTCKLLIAMYKFIFDGCELSEAEKLEAITIKIKR